MLIPRRSFVMGATGIGCSAAIASLSGSRVTQLAFGAPSAAVEGDILVNVFLRGGIDGLNAVVPYGDADYAVNRPDIRINLPGRTRGALDLNGFLGFHPAMAALHDLYKAGKVGVIHASGLPDPTRSHFDAMAMMDRGTPGKKSGGLGWITRHLNSLPDPTASMPALAAGYSVADSLLGFLNVAGLTNPQDFQFDGTYNQVDAQYQALRQTYTGTSWIQMAGAATLDVVDNIASSNPGTYVPANGAVYDTSGFANSLKTIAQMIKQGVGLRAATVDLGGWDTHENQGGDGQGYFAGQVGTLSNGLAAFYTDLTDYASRLIIVVMSEFGRRLQQNKSGGTDHGHGNIVLVIGGGVTGGVHGTWPGLATQFLDEQKDLAITTDYRQVLAEIIIRRLKNPNIYSIFSASGTNGFTYKPLGMLNGTDTFNPPGTGGTDAGPTKLAIPGVMIGLK